LVLWQQALHLLVNDGGELLNILLIPGNPDDRLPVPKLLQQVFAKVVADKAYISQNLAFATAEPRRHSTDHQAQTQQQTAIDPLE